MADVKPRPSRSNSFQRMLELERRYMLERLQANSSEPSIPSSARKPPRSSAGIQARRADASAQKSVKESRRDGTLATSPPTPLCGNPITLKSTSSTALVRQPETFLPDDVPTAVATPTDGPSPKSVAFEFPPKEDNRKSICVSPSWESHGRRKKEKKEKEEAAKYAERKGRKRRLSKQPPPSSSQALKKAERLAPDMIDRRGRMAERPSSANELGAIGKEEASGRHRRSRSGSLTSLIRSSFEFRRQPVNQDPETSFIGGIKLELERHAANEQTLHEQAKTDESDIHPALRRGKPTARPYSQPSATPSRHSVADHPAANRRTYPPTTTMQQLPRSLVSPPAACPTSDLGTIDKWRARVGLKPTSKSATSRTVPLSPADSSKVVASAGSDEDGRLSEPSLSHAALARVHTPDDRKESLDASVSSSNKKSRQSSSDSRISSLNEDRTALSTPPPEPPRRSSKRNSLVNLNASPSNLYSSNSTDHVDGSAIALPGRPAPSRPIDISAPRPDQKDPQTGASKCQATSQTPGSVPTRRRRPSGQSSPATYHRHVPISSSEDSCSDEMHSTSPPSTPATSRPQSSEQEVSLPTNDKAMMPETHVSKLALDDIANTEDGDASYDEEMDAIQAAANKVLATFCDITGPRACMERQRSHSESGPSSGRRLSLVPRELLPRRKDKPFSSSLLSLSQAKTSPAPPGDENRRSLPMMEEQLPRVGPKPRPCEYLEEARRVPPALPPSRGLKQRLGPPASFVLPGDSSTQPLPTSNSRIYEAAAGRWSGQNAVAEGGYPSRQPMAKVFVECCGCKYYHDMPSHLYEAMANPEGVLGAKHRLGCVGSVSMTVRCPWCKHEMSIKCCAGLAAMVYVQERLH